MRALLVNREWMDKAICIEIGTEPFFPDTDKDTELAAKRICKKCPVQTECLLYALQDGTLSGIWGGTSLVDRQTMKRSSRAGYSRAKRRTA